MDQASLQRHREFFEHRFVNDENYRRVLVPSRRLHFGDFSKFRAHGIRNFTFAKQKPKQQKTYQDVFKDFRHNTTLLGIQHVLQRRSIFWAIAYLFCLGMSIFQSWSVTFDFADQKTRQSYSLGNAKLLPFPSVTVCNKVVLPGNFSMSLIPGYDNSTDAVLNSSTCDNEAAMDDWEARVDSNSRAIIKYRRNLSESERIKLSGSVNSFIDKCRFGGVKCNDFDNPDKFYIFNNPFYGTCATFNPAFNKKTAIIEDVTTSLKMELNIRTDVIQLEGVKPHVAVHIHKPGAAPILDPAQVDDILPDTTVAFKLHWKVRQFMRRRTTLLSCVDQEDLTYRKKSIYYSERSPYLYTLQSCMKSCEEKYTKKRCNTSHVASPIPENEEEQRQHVMTYGVFLDSDSCTIPEELDMKLCGCPLPCLYPTYKFSLDKSDDQRACKTQNKLVGGEIHNAHINVYFVSNIYEKVEEEIMVNLSSYLGILGGNMSLWIGLCIISVLELLELLFNLIKVWCQKGKTVQAKEKDHHYTIRRQKPVSMSSVARFPSPKATSTRQFYY